MCEIDYLNNVNIENTNFHIIVVQELENTTNKGIYFKNFCVSFERFSLVEEKQNDISYLFINYDTFLVPIFITL